jgi:hypothetical protein
LPVPVALATTLVDSSARGELADEVRLDSRPAWANPIVEGDPSAQPTIVEPPPPPALRTRSLALCLLLTTAVPFLVVPQGKTPPRRGSFCLTVLRMRLRRSQTC